MNVLFLTLLDFATLNEHNIYTDLLRKFAECGHSVYTVSPTERRKQISTHLIDDGKCKILKLKIGNIQKTNILEKGLSTLLLERTFKKGIQKYFKDVQFDLILYSTPPITLAGAIKYVKDRDHARTYLLLKDIFPQNAVDIGVMTKQGIKKGLYTYFRKKEQKLYCLSDYIGCMSPANMDFVLKNNPQVLPEKVKLSPNCIEPRDMTFTEEQRKKLRKKYGIPEDKKVFIYGGNLGIPQGIPFLIDCIRSQKDNRSAVFFVVGSGTEYAKLKEFSEREPQDNFKLMPSLPKEEYDAMVASCDVGMIFLDHRFTIPNFPSRLLSYMQAKLPVLCCTDANTDIGKIVEENGFGWWCESNSTQAFEKCISAACEADLAAMGELADGYLKKHYTVSEQYNEIMNVIH